MHICFSTHCIALFPLRTTASWMSAKCTRSLFKVWRNWPNSKLICYSERGERKLSFEYKICRPHLKTYKIIPNRTFISVFVHTVLHFFHWEHRQVEGVRSAHGGSLRYEEIGQILNWYVILKGENPKLSFEYKVVGHTWKLQKLYPTVHAYMFVYTLYCIVSTENNRQVEGVRKCTRRLFKVWWNWPNSKFICYSERAEPKLSIEYKFVGHTWKLLKLYPTVLAYLFFYTLYCIVFHWEHRQVEGVRSCTRRLFKVWRNWPN